MSKRGFRPSPDQRTEYPTFAEFDRRGFLARLGAAALAVAGVGVLSACGERAIGDEPDEGGGPQGVAPPMEAGVDRYPVHVSEGMGPMPDARRDRHPLDGGPPIKDTGGVARLPDALVDPPAEGGTKSEGGAKKD
jgi:hypothetical protein